MNEDIDRCYAYSMAGQRCELIAGHDDNHSITTSWGPDECWAPGVTPVIAAAAPEPAVVHLVPGPPSRCELCDHPWHNSTCTAMDGEYPCECRTAVG